MTSPAPRRFQAGDRALLVLEDQRRFLLELQPGRSFSTHKGAIEHDDVIGEDFGCRVVTSTGDSVWALEPTWTDRMMKVQRRTNIMYPKDVGFLLTHLGLGPGSRVVELGTGSGAMTIALAHAVQPGGKVFTYDRREEFLEHAADNCERAAVPEELVEFRLRDEGGPLEADVDAVMCDIPEPWAEVPAAREALRGSGRFAAALPTYNQTERLAACLAGDAFTMISSVEVLVREILARPGRTRPAHRMVAHTQILTTGIRVLDPGHPVSDAGNETADDGGEDPEDEGGRGVARAQSGQEAGQRSGQETGQGTGR